MLSTFETILDRPRCRTWTPLATQQLRLRHLIRVIAYNVKTNVGSLYYTLHLTTMCAPFYTSEKLESQHPKWAELDVNGLQISSTSGLVFRIWQHKNNSESSDTVVLAWGISLTGLVYLGPKLSDIQPVSFKENSVIFQLNGGYFTSLHCIRTDLSKPLPFMEHLNLVGSEDATKIARSAALKCAKSDVRLSYNVKKLQRLHSLQQSIKNRALDAEDLRKKIRTKSGLVEGDSYESSDPLRERPPPVNAQANRLLSMTSLNRLLNTKQEQPTRIQRQEIARMRKLIESARFRTKLLAQERDRKLANIRKLNQECSALLDSNEDKNSELMSLYRQLSRDMEKLREWRRSHSDIRELYVHTSAQLLLRRKQLLSQLLLIYSIKKVADNRFTISDVHLPDSESLSTVPETYLSVALGFVTHIVIMCSTFLQVPLRYPMVHIGSRSKVTDHITFNVPEKDREFPLYTKGKDRMQFQYAVYLLNKNIAQLRWYCGLPTQDLRATLSNLFSLLHSSGDFRPERCDSVLSNSTATRYLSDINTSSSQQNLIKKYGSFSTLDRSFDRIVLSTPVSNSCEQLFTSNLSFGMATPIRKISRTSNSESGPGLGQILTAPSKSQCVDCNIEQGLDILDGPNSMCFVQNEHSVGNTDTTPIDLAIKLKRRVSRSVGSYTDSEDKFTLGRSHLEVGSDPLLLNTEDTSANFTADQSLPNSLGEGRKEFLQHWFNSSPALACSEGHICPEEFIGDEILRENALTIRTDALTEQNSSFHLIKSNQNY